VVTLNGTFQGTDPTGQYVVSGAWPAPGCRPAAELPPQRSDRRPLEIASSRRFAATFCHFDRGAERRAAIADLISGSRGFRTRARARAGCGSRPALALASASP